MPAKPMIWLTSKVLGFGGQLKRCHTIVDAMIKKRKSERDVVAGQIDEAGLER